MSDATVRADAQALPETEEAKRAELDIEVSASAAFEKAEARYLRALAAVLDPDDGESAEYMKSIYKESDAARRALFLIKSPDNASIWTKLEAFEHHLHNELTVGSSSPAGLMFELGSIKADVFALCN